MSYDSWTLARSDLVAYFKLDDIYDPSPSALSIPGTDDTTLGTHVNRLSGSGISLSAGQIIIVKLTANLTGGSNPNIGFASVTAGINYYTAVNPLSGYAVAFRAPSTQTDYFVYSYNGGGAAPSLAGSGTFGLGGIGVDSGPNNLGGLFSAAGGNGGAMSGQGMLHPGQATMLGGGQTGGSLLLRPSAGMSAALTDINALDLGDVWTISAIVKQTSGSQRGIVSKGAGAYYLRTNSGKFEAVRSQVAIIGVGATSPANNTRYHILIGKNGATIKLYLDGVDDTGSTSNSTTVDNTADLHIGNDTNGGDGFFEGYVERVAIFNTLLSAADAAAQFAQIDTPSGGGGSTIPGVQTVVIAG